MITVHPFGQYKTILGNRPIILFPLDNRSHTVLEVAKALIETQAGNTRYFGEDGTLCLYNAIFLDNDIILSHLEDIILENSVIELLPLSSGG